MRWDEENLAAVIQRRQPPTLRFFHFSEPTLSYGRLQNLTIVRTLTPTGWPVVRRPTAGGHVRHENDLCLSLCWRTGTPPMPRAVTQVYEWVHRLIFNALPPLEGLRLAACCDTPKAGAPFDQRNCFREPVGHDILLNAQKIAGGALAVKKGGILYQGSIQRSVIGEIASFQERVKRLCWPG